MQFEAHVGVSCRVALRVHATATRCGLSGFPQSPWGFPCRGARTSHHRETIFLVFTFVALFTALAGTPARGSLVGAKSGIADWLSGRCAISCLRSSVCHRFIGSWCVDIVYSMAIRIPGGILMWHHIPAVCGNYSPSLLASCTRTSSGQHWVCTLVVQHLRFHLRIAVCFHLNPCPHPHRTNHHKSQP